MPEGLPSGLARRLLDGERAALPDALNLIDDRRPESRERATALLAELAKSGPTPGAIRVGVTGPPGAGKSTLLDALVRRYRSRGERVGIVAVDPSSRRSGGALLGDRARVRSSSRDEGVFFRSMAARSRLGGLSDATWASVAVLSAVFDRVLIETVGVGQSEADVVDLVDTLLFVVQPASGDTLQFMKAGVLELPDLFVVNKADLGAAAERSARELEAAIAMSPPRDEAFLPRVLMVSARDAIGLDELVETLDAHVSHLNEKGRLSERRTLGERNLVFDALLRRFGSDGIERLGGSKVLQERLLSMPERQGFATFAALAQEIAMQEGTH